MQASAIESPKLIPDTTDPKVDHYIKTLDRRIRRDPEAFSSALSVVGEAATTASINISELGEQETVISTTPEKLLIGYFSGRLDYESNFDEASERALRSDPIHTQLRDKHTSMQNTHKQTHMPGSSSKEPDPEASEARDAVRRHRMAFFVARVAAWKEISRGDSRDLPSAS